MVRIIPWNLPPVNGGSVGGYTPAPTPVVTSYPYDLDNMVLSTSYDATVHASYSSYYRTLVKGILNVSGVTILDSSSVASVIATVHVTPGSDTWINADIEENIEEADIDVDISGYMTSAGGSCDITNGTLWGASYIKTWNAENEHSVYPTLSSTTATITVTSIKVYNSNGVVIQEWTP